MEKQDGKFIHSHMHHNSSSRRPARAKIIIGTMMVLVGLIFAYFFVYQKIQAMRQHEDFTYSVKAMIIVPLGVVFGLYYIIFQPSGNGAWKNLEPKEKPSFIVTLVVFFISCILLAIWFNSQLKKYGYAPIF